MKSVSSKVFSSLGQAHEFELVLAKLGIIENDIQEVIQGEKTIQFIRFIKNPHISHSSLLSDWQTFWHDLGSKADLSGLIIPSYRNGFNRLIVDVPDVSCQEIYDQCKELFPCWKWTDKSLDEVVIFNERTAKNGSYAVWCRERVEADEELKKLSVDDIRQKCLATLTLKERLIYELKYFKETGKHLDIDNWTLCAGSRYDDGCVPRVRWYDDWMYVYRFSSVYAYERLRSREAVS